MSDYNSNPVSGNKPSDPNLTLEVDNSKLEEWIKKYSSDKTVENLNGLLSCLVKCRILVPSQLNEQKQPVPCLINNDKGEVYLPFYSSKGQIPQKPKSPMVMNAPYVGINNLALGQANVNGVVVNPFTDNLILKKELLQEIKKVVEAQAKAQPKEMKLTEKQYMQFERRQYEGIFLPKKMYENPEAFFEKIREMKEEYLDELFEESYKETRMYPYLPEDFSVMLLNISEELLVAQVTMPDRDMSPCACVRIYLTWDSKKKEAHYYTIETGQIKENHVLGEITSNGAHVNHGAAPIEGAELQTIVDMASKKDEITS